MSQTRFKNDVFISYRRVANGTHDGWVDDFCDALRNSLAELVGNVTIWRDVDRLGVGPFRDELKDAIDGTAIFLALVSRTYFESDECLRELNRFMLRMKDGTGEGRRLVPVFKQPPNRFAPPPPEVDAMQRHVFFRPLHETVQQANPQNWRELAPKAGDAAEVNEFWEKLSRLSQDIMWALDELRATTENEKKKTSRGSVFLARVCPELDTQRERLRSELEGQGFQVLPRHEYLWASDRLREQIAEDVEGALLCVHLVTGQHSVEEDAATHSRLQLVIAHAQMKRSARPQPLVWIQPGDSVDASALELIDTIDTDLANEGVEVCRSSLEELKTEIGDKLPKPPAPAPVPAPAGEVALLVEESDVAASAALRALLTQELHTEAKLVKFGGASPKDAERLKRTLAACPRCIVLWSGQSEEWLADVMDLPELKAHRTPAALCVLVGGTPSAEKAAFSSARATVVDATATAASAGLRDFLAA